MQPKNATYIKGLSIAVIIVACLGILGSIIGFFALGLLGGLTASYGPDAIDMAHHHGSTHGLEYQHGLSDQASWSVLAIIISAFGVIAVLCHVVILIAGIIGLRGYADPARYGTIMGWSIAGAVLSIISGGFICMVLLIIVAVLAYKGRAATPPPHPNGQQPPQAPVA